MDIGYWGGMLGNYTGGGGGDWSFAPAVDKWKWLDSRRVTVLSDRWSRNKTDILQHVRSLVVTTGRLVLWRRDPLRSRLASAVWSSCIMS